MYENETVPPAVTAFDGADGAEEPTPFLATTVNVYDVPEVRPETVIGLEEPEAVTPPGDDVTVYPVIVEPFDAPGVKETETLGEPETPVAVTDVGESGADGVVTAFDDADGDDPATFTAFTWNVYEVPSARPVIDVESVEPETACSTVAGVDVTTYELIVAPPSERGAAHDTVAERTPAVALTDCGAEGAEAVEPLGEEPFGDEPTTFTAVTWNVYEVSYERPETAAERASAPRDC